MEPKQPERNVGAERTPEQQGAAREQYVAPGAQPEHDSSARRVEHEPNVGDVRAEVAQVAMPVLPTVQSDDTGGTAATGSLSDNSLAANDDDLIEKEWVEKAKHILSSTRDDPHRREREISQLQQDYIFKRYGRKIGGDDES